MPSTAAHHAAPPELDTQIVGFQHFQLLCQAMPVPVLVLNNDLRVVVANDLCLELLGLADCAKIQDSSLGQALGCSCGQSSLDSSNDNEDAKKCGAYACVELCSDKLPQHCECQIVDARGELSLPTDGELPLLDIGIDAKLLAWHQQDFFVVTLTDLSNQKRQRSLEQLFFHDILNTAGGMQGISEVLLDAEPDEVSELQDSVRSLAEQLVAEITAQRDLLAAENGELKIKPQLIQSRYLLRTLTSTYENHPSTGRREIQILEPNGSFPFTCDPIILSRVLGNMLKNALEASVFPEIVTLTSTLLGGGNAKPGQVVFSVHNPGYIPIDSQGQIFRRSFSTKGLQRGLGTLSMRLLTEKYLGGSISFSSDCTSGTIFSVTLPLAGP